MRYTKYNYNKKNKNKKNNNSVKFALSMLGGILTSCIIGLAVAWVIMKVLPINDFKPPAAQVNGEIEDQETKKQDDNKVVIDSQGEKSQFYFIQCGYFSKKENADQVFAKISSEEGAFIVEEDGKFRVFSGMYNKEDVDSTIEKIKNNGVESVKVTFSLNEQDKVQSQISAICDGYLKVLNTSFEENVKNVNTTEFKGWLESLEDISEGQNVETLKSLKDHIRNLPEEISKENVSEQMNNLYKFLVVFK